MKEQVEKNSGNHINIPFDILKIRFKIKWIYSHGENSFKQEYALFLKHSKPESLILLFKEKKITPEQLAVLTFPKTENKQPGEKQIKSWVAKHRDSLKCLKDMDTYLLEAINDFEFNPIAIIFLAIQQLNALSDQKLKSNSETQQETLKKIERKISIFQEQLLKTFGNHGFLQQCVHYLAALRDHHILSEKACIPLNKALALRPSSKKLSGLFGLLPSPLIEKIFVDCNALEMKNALSLAGFWKMDRDLNNLLSKPEIFSFDTYNFFLISGTVYACGQNDKGQLGLGDTHNRAVFTPVEALKNIPIRRIISTDINSVFFLTRSGQIYACGENQNGQLGLGNVHHYNTPTWISALEKERVIRIISSDWSTYFLTQSGRVYTCVINSIVNLDPGDQDAHHTPVLLNALKHEHIIKIISAIGSTYFLAQSGQVYAYGLNDAGHLGLGDNNNRNTPTQIQSFEKEHIIEIRSSHWSTYFLTQSGQVYVCGANPYGQLGLGDKNNRNTPTRIETLKQEHITKIINTIRSVYFLTASGQVYACGRNKQGELGLGDTNNHSIPTRISVLEKEYIAKIICPIPSAFFLTQSGKVYACGGNLYGRLGLNLLNNEPYCTPTQINTLRKEHVVNIISSDWSTYFLTQSGKVYACGGNICGELGLGDKHERKKPQLIHALEKEHIIKIKTDNFSTFFLSKNKKISVCGLNQYRKFGFDQPLEEIHSPKKLIVQDKQTQNDLDKNKLSL